MPQFKDVSITKTVAGDNDWLVLQTPEGQTYKIKVSDFLAGLSQPPTTTLPTLTFSSFGDSNGMCYWLATRNNTAWSNPHIADKLTVLASSVGAGSLANLVDRQQGGSNYTTNSANSWWGIDFKTHKLKVTDYVIRQDGNSGYAIRSFKLQGSSDGTSWTDLNTQTDNTTLNSPYDWMRVSVSGVTVGYRYLRVIMTAVNSSGTWEFCCGELEFYGEVQAL